MPLRLVLIFFFLFFSTRPVLATTFTQALSNGANDSTVTSGSSFTNSATTAQFGLAANNPTNHFFLFTNVTIPQGATINSAVFSIISTGSQAGTVNLRIAAQDTDSAATPADLTEFTSKQNNLTSTVVDWSGVATAGWGVGITSPNIGSVIQAIVNRSGWQSGNSILLWVGNNNSSAWSNRTYITADYSGGEAKPSISIDYTAPVPTDTPVPTNTPTPTPTPSNHSLSFDGNGDYVVTDNTVNLTGTTAVTLEFWLKWNAFANDDRLAFESSTDSNNNPGAIIIDPNSSNGAFEFTVHYIGWRAETIPRPSAGVWHHYAVIFDSGTANGDVTIYLDGQLQESQIVSNNFGGPVGSEKMGNYTWYFMSRAGSSLFGDGYLDDVRIYNRPLSQSEILDSVNSDLVGNESGLVANWKFNEGFGTSLSAVGSQTIAATLHNASWSTNLPSPLSIPTSTPTITPTPTSTPTPTNTPVPTNTPLPTNTTAPTPTTNPLLTTFSKSISSGLNDCQVSNNTYSNNATTALLGTNLNNTINHFFLFDNITIARGTTITSADFTVTLTGSNAGTVNLTLAAQDTGNATVPSTLDEFTSRQSSLTTAIVDWNDLPSTGYGTTIVSPDLTSIVQSIINRSDWSTGNSIQIWAGNNSSTAWANRTFMTGDYAGSEQKPTLRISYILANFAPEPAADSYSTSSAMTFNVLLNDSDPDNDSLTLTQVSTPSHGTAEIISNQILYTPGIGYSGSDSFTYTVSDGHSHTATASVAVTVLSNPIYYTLDFTANRSAVPSLYYNDLTYNIHLGVVASAVVYSGGSTLASTYSNTTGDLVFTTTQTSFQILIKNPADTNLFSVAKSALKDNKKWAWSHGMDDNVNLQAQVNLMTQKGWRGLLFLIGKDISDTRNESWIYDKPALTSLLSQGWSLGNHTWDHECFGVGMSDPTFLSNTILNGYNKIDEIVQASSVPSYKILAFAAPCFATEYDSYVVSLRSAGTIAVKYNESQANGLMQIDVGAAGFSNSGKSAVAVSSNTIKIGRDLGIETSADNTIANLDWMAANASSTRHFWYNTLSHGNKEGVLQPVADHANNSYGPAGTNEIWVAPSDEIYSYLLVRDNTVLSASTLTQVADGSSPTITQIGTTISSTSAYIIWSSSRQASSKILFGTSTSLDSSTPETDVNTRQSSHSVQLTNLLPCTKYYYQTVSTDVYEATGRGTLGSFITSGCTATSAILANTDNRITTGLGGTLSLVTGVGDVNLAIPVGFSSSNADFQVFQLDHQTFFDNINPPSNYQAIGDLVVNIKALLGTTEPITSFDQPLDITLSYLESDIVGIDPATLVIFRYHDNIWSPLSNCQVNTSSHTVTCVTSQFSDFAIFGQPIQPSPTPTPTLVTTNTPTSVSVSQTPVSTSNSSSSVCSDQSPGPKTPTIYGAIPQDGDSVLLYFTPADRPVSRYILEYGSRPGQYPYSVLDLGQNSSAQMTFLVKSLSPKTKYYFRLRAANGCSVGPWSNLISSTTKSTILFKQLKAAQPVFQVSPPSGICMTYTVKPRDTLWNIAKSMLKNGSLYQNIIKENKKKYPSIVAGKLHVGWRLSLNCQSTKISDATLNLKLVNQKNQPLAKAKITLDGNHQPVITSDLGTIKLPHLSLGQHQLSITYSGYQTIESIFIPANTTSIDHTLTLTPSLISFSSLL